MLSSAMAFAVLSDPKPDRRRAMELERREGMHAHLLPPLSLGAAMFVIMVGFTLDEPLMVLFSLPLSAIALILDSRLLALRSEVRWSVPS
jgi:hypothetical protein